MFVCNERVVRDGRLVAFEGEEMTEEEAAARGLASSVQPEPEEPKLEELTVAQLREIAEQEGVEVPAKAKKADIIDAINGDEEDLYDDEEEEECE